MTEPSVSAGRAPSRGATGTAHRPGRRRLSWARVPLSAVLAVLAWLGALAAGGPGRAPEPLVTGVQPVADGRWWTVVTSAAWWGGAGGLLLTTALVLAVGSAIERTVGRARAAALLAGVHVIATLVTLGLVAAADALGSGWAADLAGQLMAGIVPALFGAAAAATTRMSALWRRRLRLVLVAVAVMLVAYSGELSDLTLLVATVTGLLAGPRLLGHPDRTRAPSSTAEARVLLALVVAASAIGPVVAALARAPIGPLSVLQFVVLSPPEDAATVQQLCSMGSDECQMLQAQLRLSGLGPALGSIVVVLLMLVVAEGLRRGRRVALVVGVALNLVLAALGVVLAFIVLRTPEEQVLVYGAAPGARQLLALVLPPLLPLAVAVLLWRRRAAFTVPAPAGARRRLVIVTAVTFVAMSVTYVLVGALVAGQFDRPPTVAGLLADLPSRFLPPGYLGEVEPSFLPLGGVATVLFEWTGPVFWLVLSGALLALFVRSSVNEPPAATQARELLRSHGGSNLAWMTTWRGNGHWIGPAGRSAVAYRVLASVAVTVGDPVGVPADRVAAVERFAAFCRERGWTPALYSVTEPIRARCAELGWSTVQVAEETVLDLPGLEFTGKRWQDVRSAFNNARKAGITAEWIRFSQAPLAITDQIRAISEAWVADKGLPEMGFTLGGLDELADPEVRCLIAVDADRTVHGVTSWLPIYRGDGVIVGWTLDFMRRRTHGGFRPVMEFLIASAARLARDEGCGVLSLSGAPLARLDRAAADGHAAVAEQGGLQRVLDVLGGALEPVYGFRSLLAFKEKFQPRHEPLYLAYPDPMALPAIGIAIGRAYLPDLGARSSARLLTRLRRRPLT